MSQCNLDHSLEDVKKKYDSQVEFISEGMQVLFEEFFEKEHSQDILNEVFHLLKKYDLADEKERNSRNKQLSLILQNT